MQKTNKKGTVLRKRTLCFLLSLVLLLSVAAVGLSGAATADDTIVAPTGNNYTNETTDIANVKPSASSAQAYWVDATYYDYYSDEEMSGSKWLEPKQAGTGFSSDDDWYTFESFNSKISSYANTNSMTYPLYFGNFCNVVSQKNSGTGSYIDSAYEFTIQNDGGDRTTSIVKPHGGSYARVIDGLYKYQYFINNSNGLNERHDSVIGLAKDSLDANGNILDPSGVKMPYFDASWLTTNSAGKSIKSYFPFRYSTNAAGVTTYSFDSAGARDNVYFNWTGKKPDSVAYGQNENYGVRDGLYNFMGDGYTAGYGIFPFNRKDGNGGSSNLDYGFGIKMNMDFRVPEYGTVNGKSNGDPVTFEYSGDDDLWVYLSEYDDSGNLTNSRLVLDLGGNHKQAQGKIDFKNMQSTITTEAAFANSNLKYKCDRIYVACSDDWSDVNIWAWDDNGSGGHWVTKKQSPFEESGHKVYEFKLSDFNGCYHFTTVENQDWSGHRAKDEGKNLNCVLHSQLGNLCWSDNPNWIDPKYPADGEYTDLSGVTYATAAQKTKSLGSRLDPNKTYHLTVFYMERGMIESNCMMKFTMTPVKNDLKVKKTIHTDWINSGLTAAVKAQNLSFVNTVNSVADTAYTLTDGQVKTFYSYDTGSSVSVAEKKSADGILWGLTEWELIDNNQNGAVLKNGTYLYDEFGDDPYETSTATDLFDLQDPHIATNTAKLQVNFDNWPVIGAPMNISKSVEGGDGSGDTFSFEFLVDLSGHEYSSATASNFVGYNLTYDKTVGESTTSDAGTMTNGRFTIKANEQITIEGLPVGATYVLKETAQDGYAVQRDFTGTIGANNGDNDISVVNTQLSSSGSMKIKKSLSSNGETTPYKDGSLFTFRASGVDAFSYNGNNTVSTKGSTLDVDTVNAAGEAVFAVSGTFLNFHRPGVYVYQLSEVGVNPADSLDKDNLVSYQSDITVSDQKFLAVFTVSQSGSDLSVDGPVYYSFSGGTVSAASLAPANAITGIPEFVNPVATGSVTVNKTDYDKNDPTASPLKDVYFNIYRVDGDQGEIMDENAVGEPKATDADGIASFTGLDLYQKTGDSYTGSMAYQWYALVETQTKDGHMIDKTVNYFTLPMLDETAPAPALKYDITFDYVNAAIKNPETAGPGSTPFKVAGLMLMVLAVASVMAYAYQSKRRYRPFHLR